MAQNAEATRPVRKGKRVSPTRHLAAIMQILIWHSNPFLGRDTEFKLVLPSSSLIRYLIRIVSIRPLATVTRTWASMLELVTFPTRELSSESDLRQEEFCLATVIYSRVCPPI